LGLGDLNGSSVTAVTVFRPEEMARYRLATIRQRLTMIGKYLVLLFFLVSNTAL